MSEDCDKFSNLAKKTNDEWTDFCKMINQDWAIKYRELQEENGRLKNQLSKLVEGNKNVK